jgi:O-antigen ligase
VKVLIFELYLLIYAIIPVAGLVKIFFGSSVLYLLLDLVFVALLLYFINVGRIKKTDKVHKILTTVLLAVTTMTAMWGNFDGWYSKLMAIRLSGLFVLAIYLPRFLNFNQDNILKLYRCILIVGLVVSVNGIRQYLIPFAKELDFARSGGGASAFFGDDFQGGVNDFRVFSFFTNSVHLVSFLSYASYLVIAKYLVFKNVKHIELISFVVGFVCIVMTFSRTGWMSYVLGLMALFPTVSWKKRLRLLFILVILLGVAMMLFENNELVSNRLKTLYQFDDVSSFNSRLILWGERLKDISESFFGYGLGVAGWNVAHQTGFGADSNYLKFFIELGWFGGVVAISLQFHSTFLGFKNIKDRLNARAKDYRAVLQLASLAFILNMSFAMIANQMLEAYPANLVYWFSLGYVVLKCKNTHI